MIVNANAIVQHVIQIKNGIRKTCQCDCQNYRTCQNSKYLKRIANTSVIECDEIIIVIENVFKKMANTIAANVMSTASINCHSKK